MPAIDLDKIRQYFSTQPVLKAWLFGSFARGEQTEDSDVDIMVNFSDSITLFKHINIISDLEKLLNKKVDIVPADQMYPRVRRHADKEKILIYERVS